MSKFAKFSLFIGLFWASVLFSCQQRAPGPAPEIKIGRNYDLALKWEVPDTSYQTKVFLEKRQNGGIHSSDTLMLGTPTLSIDNFGRLDGVSVKMLTVGKDGQESMPTEFSLAPPKDTGIIITVDIVAFSGSLGNSNPCASTATYSTIDPTASETNAGTTTTRYDLHGGTGSIYKVSMNTGTTTIVYLLSPKDNGSTAYSTNYSCLTGSGFSIVENDTTLLYSNGGISFRTRPSCARLSTDPACLFKIVRIIYPQSWTVTVERCTNCN